MATNENLIPIPGRLHSVATEGHVAGADEIYDDTLGKTQAEINQESQTLPDNLAYLGDDDGQAVIPGFDPQTDTLHKAAQVLTTAEKDQVAQNLNNRPSTNGMARIELKATDNFKSVVEAQTGGNTVFVIKYDYTLTGDVTVPANCILEFEGGSINSDNYVLTLNNTYVKGISNSSIKIDGTFKYDTIDSFGISPVNSAAVNTANIEKFNSNHHNNLKFGSGVYNFSSPIILSGTDSADSIVPVSIKGKSKNETKLIFSGDGIRFAGGTYTSWFNKTEITDISIQSNNGNCIDLCYNNKSSINNALFSNILLKSPNGACFYQTVRSLAVYSNTFYKVTFADSKYAFNNCSLSLSTTIQGCIDLGVEIYLYNIVASGEGLVCRDLACGCNHTMKHFMFVDKGLDGFNTLLQKVTILNSSFEEVTSNIIAIVQSSYDIIYRVKCDNCNFNCATFAPTKNYVYNTSLQTFAETDFTNSDNYYPFIGNALIIFFKDCSYTFYGTRSHSVKAVISNDNYTYHQKANEKIGDWVIVAVGASLFYCNDSDFINLSEVPGYRNTDENRHLKIYGKVTYFNSSGTSLKFYIHNMEINFDNKTRVEVDYNGNGNLKYLIATNNASWYSTGTRPTALSLFRYDTGVFQTWNGSNWVYPTGATV